MSVGDFLFGRALRSSEEGAEKLGAAAGIPVFGLDGLSSAAYGPEAALALLIALGAAGVHYIVPITLSIVGLLVIVYFSYRQTIEAYPKGGGSYTVAGQNLGPFAGLLAAAALMTDYVLTAAVGISAGVGALVSAAPSLEKHTLALCLAILVLVTLINLRGSRETGIAFMVPTYAFVGTLLAIIGMGMYKSVAAGGHPTPVSPPPMWHAATATFGIWLALKAFASGCTAMTGVEAVSNGVSAFREPVVKTAQRTLTVIVGLLIAMLAGIAYLCRAYQIGATETGPGYQSVLSQLTAAVAGRSLFYFVTMGSVLTVLALSANTAFADFPRLCRLLAEDGYLPSPLAVRGRRLVYTVGISVLAVCCAALLILFGGVTDRLIPLYAVGAFLAFTLSQTGMVVHWRRVEGSRARLAMLVNALGAVATAVTVAIVATTKFLSGAWITTLVIPAIIAVMYATRRHYDEVNREIACPADLDLGGLNPPIVVLPIASWNKIARAGLQFAVKVSREIHILHVCTGDPDEMRDTWRKAVEEPMRRAGIPVPQLKEIRSPYRFVIQPIVDYVAELEKKWPDRQIAVIIPEFVEKHWYNYFLHNERATWLKSALLRRKNGRTVVINVPWRLDS